MFEGIKSLVTCAILITFGSGSCLLLAFFISQILFGLLSWLVLFGAVFFSASILWHKYEQQSEHQIESHWEIQLSQEQSFKDYKEYMRRKAS